MRISIYEAFCFCEINSIKVVDDESDYTALLSCKLNRKEAKTPYDKLMRFFCTHIEISNYRPNSYSNAFITEFIDKYRIAFESFAKETKSFDSLGKPSLHKVFDDFIKSKYSDDDCKRFLNILNYSE